MIKKIFCNKKWIAISLIIVLLSGCLGEDSNQETDSITEQALNKQVDKETVKTIPIELMSDEMDTLRLKGWEELSGQLGRTKTATLLWYHIKKNYNI